MFALRGFLENIVKDEKKTSKWKIYVKYDGDEIKQKLYTACDFSKITIDTTKGDFIQSPYNKDTFWLVCANSALAETAKKKLSTECTFEFVPQMYTIYKGSERIIGYRFKLKNIN